MPGVVDYFTPKDPLQAQLDAKEAQIEAWNEAHQERDTWK